MKVKTLVASLVVLFGLSCLFSPVANADNTVCTGARVLRADGTEQTGSFTAVGQDRWYKFEIYANRSYAIFAENLSNSDTASVVNQFVNVVIDACGGASLGGTNLSFIETAPLTDGDGGTAIAIRPTTTTTAFKQLFGTDGGSFRIRVEETTLFNPAWSTFGTFETFYSCINVTDSGTLDATLRLFNTAGAEVGSFNFDNIPAGGTVSTNTGTLGVADGNGSATLTHNGPPGGIICEAAIADFATAPRVIQPVKFQRRNND